MDNTNDAIFNDSSKIKSESSKITKTTFKNINNTHNLLVLPDDYKQSNDIAANLNFDNTDEVLTNFMNDTAKILNLIQTPLTTKNINFFDEYPSNFKNLVLNTKSKLSETNKNNKQLFDDDTAKNIISSFIENYKKEQTIDSLNPDEKDISFIDTDRSLMESLVEINRNMFFEIDKIKKNFLEERIKQYEIEKPEISNIFRRIQSKMQEAYDLKFFAEFCLRCKIKKFELSKPNKIFKLFTNKYENVKTHITIGEIANCPDILEYHLPKFTKNQIIAFCLAFCKYCRDLDPNNIIDHTFMYYTIRNITAINQINPKNQNYDSLDEKSKDFYDKFIENLSLCIFNLLKRNVTLK